MAGTRVINLQVLLYTYSHNFTILIAMFTMTQCHMPRMSSSSHFQNQALGFVYELNNVFARGYAYDHPIEKATPCCYLVKYRFPTAVALKKDCRRGWWFRLCHPTMMDRHSAPAGRRSLLADHESARIRIPSLQRCPHCRLFESTCIHRSCLLHLRTIKWHRCTEMVAFCGHPLPKLMDIAELISLKNF